MGASPSNVRDKNEDIRRFWSQYYNANGGASASNLPTVDEIKEKKKKLLDASSASSSSLHTTTTTTTTKKSKKIKNTNKNKKKQKKQNNNNNNNSPTSTFTKFFGSSAQSNHGGSKNHGDSATTLSDGDTVDTGDTYDDGDDDEEDEMNHHDSDEGSASSSSFSTGGRSSLDALSATIKDVSTVGGGSSGSSSSSSGGGSMGGVSHRHVKTRDQFKNWKHFSKITSILMLKESHRDVMFTSSLDKHICKWSLNESLSSNMCEQVYSGHSKAVTSLFMRHTDDQQQNAFNGGGNDGDDGQTVLYSTSQDCTVRAWNIETGECIRVYHGSENWLTCGIATENYVCCAGYDCNIHVFDEKSGKRLHKLSGHSKRIEHLVLSLESDILYSSSADGTIRSWDIESGDCIRVFLCRDHCTQIALYEPKNLLFCSLFNEIAVFDMESDHVYAPILGLSSFHLFEHFIIGWDSDSKLFRVWDIEQEKFLVDVRCSTAGSMISTPDMVVHDGSLYFIKGTSVQCTPIPKLDRKKHKGKGKQSESASNDQTPAYVRFLSLFNYFTDVLMMPSRQVADSIAKLESENVLSVEMNLDTQIEHLLFHCSKLEKKQHIREGKRSESTAPDVIETGDDYSSPINFSISINLPDHEYEGESIYTEEERSLDFETRTELFYQRLLPDDAEVQQPTVVLVRRSDLVFDACKHFSTMTQSDLRRPMYIFFAHEPGLDMGGVTREFYKLLSEQILDRNNALFLKTGMNGTYHPNPTSVVNEDHLQYFTFIGKLVGKCLYDMNLMDTHFSRVIFKMIIGKPITFEDLEYCDPSMFLAMKNILSYDQVEHMYLTFSAELNDFGSNNTFPLVYDGDQIPVTNENKRQFVELYSRWKLVESVRPQLTLFLSGLYSIIPRPYFSIFSESELELLLCGKPTISVRDWQQHCRYEAGFSESHPTIHHFWKMVGEMSDTQRSQLLQFVTGTSCVPPEGFRGLYPNFTICCVRVPKSENKNRYLPVAHTCLNRLDFPAYDICDWEPSLEHQTSDSPAPTTNNNNNDPLSVTSMSKLFDAAVKHGLVDGFLLH